MTDNRLNGADFVRAAACLTVLFHHLAQRMSWQDQLAGLEWFRIFAQIGTFGVAMFFVLSGFLLSRPFWQALDRGEPAPSLRIYAMRRAARILPGFWLALLVTFVLSITVFGAVLDGQLLLRLAAGIFTVADWHWVTLFPVEVNGPLWSISFEVTSYLLLPLGFAALFFVARWAGTGWQSRLMWLGVIGLALVAHWLLVQFYPVDTYQRGWDYGLIGGAKSWMPRFNPFGFFAMFAIGALAGGLQVRWARYRNGLFDAIGLAGLAWGISLMDRQLSAETADGWGWLGVPYGFPWFVLAVGLFLSAAPSSVLLGRLLDNPATRYIARISFGIYIWHYVVLELVRLYWDPQIDHGQASDPVRFVVTCGLITVITLTVAHLSYHLVENPVIQWARGKERRSAGSASLSQNSAVAG
jgi:peptidoglycan/LPS O-acetylase OafA/YrhL